MHRDPDEAPRVVWVGLGLHGGAGGARAAPVVQPAVVGPAIIGPAVVAARGAAAAPTAAAVVGNDVEVDVVVFEGLGVAADPTREENEEE